jgi:hypothetical protein
MTTMARKEKRRPPLTTLATRAMSITFSMNSEGSFFCLCMRAI